MMSEQDKALAVTLSYLHTIICAEEPIGDFIEKALLNIKEVIEAALPLVLEVSKRYDDWSLVDAYMQGSAINTPNEIKESMRKIYYLRTNK